MIYFVNNREPWAWVAMGTMCGQQVAAENPTVNSLVSNEFRLNSMLILIKVIRNFLQVERRL